jgi:hypothetical protein
MEDGSLVVCERSLSGSGGGPSAASAQQYVRAEMLPSGYLVRPCEGGGSIVHIVDHLDLEAWSVPEVLRPLYESSRVVAQKMTTAVSCREMIFSSNFIDVITSSSFQVKLVFNELFKFHNIGFFFRKNKIKIQYYETWRVQANDKVCVLDKAYNIGYVVKMIYMGWYN